jgi:hypothetical protein
LNHSIGIGAGHPWSVGQGVTAYKSSRGSCTVDMRGCCCCWGQVASSLGVVRVWEAIASADMLIPSRPGKRTDMTTFKIQTYADLCPEAV